MYLLVEDAFRLWREIPDQELIGVVEEAIVEAGAFMATAGLVKRCWVRRSAKTIPMLGHVESAPTALEEAGKWDEWWNGLTEEEREEENRMHREFFGGLANKLKGAG